MIGTLLHSSNGFDGARSCAARSPTGFGWELRCSPRLPPVGDVSSGVIWGCAGLPALAAGSRAGVVSAAGYRPRCQAGSLDQERCGGDCDTYMSAMPWRYCADCNRTF